MPPLPKFFRDLLAAQTPVNADRASGFLNQTAATLRIVADQGVDLLGSGMGGVLAEGGVAAERIKAPMTAGRLRAAPGMAAILEGKTLEPGQKSSAVLWIQRALQAIGTRIEGAHTDLLLGNWGADADFGGETTAGVKAMQARLGLTQDGKIGPKFARGLIDALDGTQAPDLFKGVDPSSLISAGARRIVGIANAICDAPVDTPYTQRVGDETFSYVARVFGTEAHERGTLMAPGGASYGLRPGTEYWKCNIFVGTVIALAALPVPTFRWSRTASSLHFPRAEKFGDRLAAKPGWQMVMYLDHRDPADETQALTGHTQQTDISEMLLSARPGDLLFVDHPGRPGEDGGHCRVCVAPADPNDSDLAPAFAQARSDAAKVERDGLRELGDGAELQLWLVRHTG